MPGHVNHAGATGAGEAIPVDHEQSVLPNFLFRKLAQELVSMERAYATLQWSTTWPASLHPSVSFGATLLLLFEGFLLGLLL
jgi:hypothetical protein